MINQPTHTQMSHLEHAIVTNRRRLYALHESGQLDRERDVRLELDYLARCYFKYHHMQGNEQANPYALKSTSNKRDGSYPANYAPQGSISSENLKTETRSNGQPAETYNYERGREK